MEPLMCSKCGTDICTEQERDSHVCPVPKPMWVTVLAVSIRGFHEAAVRALAYAAVFLLVWHWIRLDIATVIGVGLRAAEGCM